MNVWLMNLKDNRDNPDQNLEMTKFDFCKSKGILGIGWVGYDESSDDSAFLLANNYLNSFAVGDLVWTRDPETPKYYLCKIKTIAQNANDEFNKYDISRFCYCDYIEIGSSDELPEEIDKESLVARHTISKCDDNIKTATINFCNDLSRCSGNSFKTHKKKLLITLIAVISFAILVVGGLLITDIIRDTIAYKKVCDQLDGRVFINKHYDESFEVFAIRDGEIAYEQYNGSDEIYGDINSYDDLKVNTHLNFSFARIFGGSFFDSSLKIENKGGLLCIRDFYLSDDGTISFSDAVWEEITFDDYESIKNVLTCNHEYKTKTTKKATCTEAGESTSTCKICGHTVTETISASHNYSANGVCKVCNQKKPAEKTTLEGDTWYTANAWQYLQVKNFIIKDVVPADDHAMVTGYHFCAYCKAIDELIKMHGPEVGYPVIKTLYCKECGKYTTVQLKIELY